jgi:hypothetical protein
MFLSEKHEIPSLNLHPSLGNSAISGLPEDFRFEINSGIVFAYPPAYPTLTFKN